MTHNTFVILYILHVKPYPALVGRIGNIQSEEKICANESEFITEITKIIKDKETVQMIKSLYIQSI